MTKNTNWQNSRIHLRFTKAKYSLIAPHLYGGYNWDKKNHKNILKDATVKTQSDNFFLAKKLWLTKLSLLMLFGCSKIIPNNSIIDTLANKNIQI